MSRARPGSPIQRTLEALHRRHAGNGAGSVATYIPELARANPDHFGICLATVDGHLYEVGDTRLPFTIQSISKPFAYGLALGDRGRDAVRARVGVEPSGEAFNSIRLGESDGRPPNPMVNAGAIATTALVAGDSPADRLERIVATLSLYAGRTLDVDPAVYGSERATGHRNRAIAHLLRNFSILEDDPEAALDLYFRQCAIAVTCLDLARMGATLANGGVNPGTGERALRADLVPSVLSVMATCGMYDYAGEWLYEVGVPAKSGVSGGVVAVLPGQLGIGVFSPLLDERGNSVRGMAVCRDLSREFDLHFLGASRPVHATLRARHDLRALRSKRQRSPAEDALLAEEGARVRVYELQGDVAFGALEAVLRQILADVESADLALVDLRRVTRMAVSAASLVGDLAAEFSAHGRRLAIAGAQRHAVFRRRLDEQSADAPSRRPATFPDLDRALEWAEGQLLAKRGARAAPARLPLAEHPACRGLSPEQVETLEKLLEPLAFPGGATILRKGDPVDRMYFLVEGEVSVVSELESGELRRLSTLAAGAIFGEIGAATGELRTADVRADSPSVCFALELTSFARLAESHPELKLALLENLLANASRTVARLTREVETLAR